MSNVRLKSFQDEFLFSEKKFPCLCAGVGTGKTYMLLLKIWNHCLDYPGSVALIVRKEYTDLRDSTLKDVLRYFNVNVDGNKEYKFDNGSVIMFRHGAELNVLKNMTLSIIGIEQSEEFENDQQFTFLRDRLRHPIGTLQLCQICNANGHNWVWKGWVNNRQSAEYHLVTATTFDNIDNLRPEFIADLKTMELESPNHYKQYVMNSFEEMGADNYVFNFDELIASQKLDFLTKQGFGHRLAGFDIARYGNDKCCAFGLIQCDTLRWSEFHVEEWSHKDLDYTTGRILSIANVTMANDSIIDEDGLGAGPLDFIAKGRQRQDFKGFRNKTYGFEENKFYGNVRTEAAFELKDLVRKGHLRIKDEDTVQELMTLRYRFMSDGRRILLSKEEMRKQGIKSPNRADALLMAASLIKGVFKKQENYYVRPRSQQVSRETSLFKLAGFR